MHSLGPPDVCLRQSWLVIGQFGCSRNLPPSDANFGKGEARHFIESECKNIVMNYIANCCALNLKVKAKILTSLLKNWTLNIQHMGFYRCSPLCQRRLVGKCTEWISHQRSPTKRMNNGEQSLSLTHLKRRQSYCTTKRTLALRNSSAGYWAYWRVVNSFIHSFI